MGGERERAVSNGSDTAEKTGGQTLRESGTLRAWSECWLSAPRLSPYLAACGGDPACALDLYLWNVGLCQVLVADISHFEVTMRNAYDRVMRERWRGDGHWLLEDASPVRAPIMRTSKSKRLPDVNIANRKAISQAQGRALVCDKLCLSM